MAPAMVSANEIASVAGLTKKHVRRMMRRAQGLGPHVSPLWFGERMRIHQVEGEELVEFRTLPVKIREAFVMLDQPEFPLTPPGSN